MGWAPKLAGWAVAVPVWFAAASVSAADLQWSPFRSPEHGFAADFPGSPALTTSGTPDKDKMVQYEFQTAIGTDYAYEIAVLEFSAGYAAPAATAEIYDKLVQGYANGSNSTLRTQHPRTIAGQPGIEAVSDDDKNDMHHLIDLVIANDRVYIVVSAGPKGHETSPEAIRFRDSFAFIGK
ncbi:MAG TPA: hypothetical protein VN808_03425 [Stellaceae bacterium]|nr:hypothetical protein [Stellaceae bacterium]